ncbi:MAG: AAA family ATPase [Anaerolineae bacterium]|nr:AAA family ATPase [Anaerolineae bacterium]
MITTLEMINWRAYTSRKIVFDSGITFLMGPNGAGKTSDSGSNHLCADWGTDYRERAQ